MRIEIDAKTLAAVATAQASEATRYYLCGVCFDGDDVIATDGHLLTVAPGVTRHLDTISDATELTDKRSPILPISGKAITALKRRDSTRAVFDGVTLSVYGAKSDTVPYHLESSAPIAGTFPDWRRVLPEVPDSATCPGMFGDALLARIAATAKILGAGKSIGVQLKGVDDSSAHRVRYFNGVALDTYSVAMPMRPSK